MTTIDVGWRTNHKGIPPRPIKLEIPGWSGHDLRHNDGASPQPWHCPPFVDGSTYGLELLYPFDAQCTVSMHDGVIRFDADFSPEMHSSMGDPPFKAFAPRHYGFTSSLDLQVPDDMVVRLEPHPRYFTDHTDTCPCAVPGHIQGSFWPRIFFVVFKAPPPGQTHVFRKGEPYAQILIVARKVHYDVRMMGPDSARERELNSGYIHQCSDQLARHTWLSDSGQKFNDKYKVLQAADLKRGRVGVEETLKRAMRAWLATLSRSRGE